MITDQVFAELEKHADPGAGEVLGRFFKTGAGQYGEGDLFIGVKVPPTRVVAKQFMYISLQEIEQILDSPIHEMRLCACIIMTERAKKAVRKHNSQELADLFRLYLRRTDRINNWDIVDTSCRDVVGSYLLDHPEEQGVLRKLAISDSIWERRIAMISTWQFMRAGQLDQTYEIATLLLSDKHDLIHKAVGWMLRVAGDKDADRLRAYLTDHIGRMPRTALRYAIEHFGPEERQYFLRLRG